MSARKPPSKPVTPQTTIANCVFHNGPRFDAETNTALVALANASAEHGKALQKIAGLFDGTSSVMNAAMVNIEDAK